MTTPAGMLSVHWGTADRRRKNNAEAYWSHSLEDRLLVSFESDVLRTGWVIWRNKLSLQHYNYLTLKFSTGSVPFLSTMNTHVSLHPFYAVSDATKIQDQAHGVSTLCVMLWA